MVLDRGLVLRDGPWIGRNLYDLYEEAHTPWEWVPELMARGLERGVEVFSSPFDTASVQFLDSLGVKRFKIASFELVDVGLIRYAAGYGKPLILSTGMAERGEIQDAIWAAKAGGAHESDITLLKCTSAYPAGAEHANLRTMAHMKQTWGCEVGLSDHTPGIAVALIAAAMGATMIEKHLVLDDGEATLDREFSITPAELAFLCKEAPKAAAAPGEAVYGPRTSERPQLELRRSLHYARNLEAGETIEPGDIVTARPSDGMPCRMMGKTLGRQVSRPVRRGDPVTFDTLQPESRGVFADV
jgi:N-acetylneuraminate synthase